ncbi:MAG: glycosyltransferase family 92 protein [Waddliaceae bacterium]
MSTKTFAAAFFLVSFFFVNFIPISSALSKEMKQGDQLFSFETVSKDGQKTRKKKKKYYLSLCAIFRDEARFLKEWIEFHRLVGVEHFYLINHLSGDDYKSVLAPYIKRKIVELHQCKHQITDPGRWSSIQTSAYQKIIDKSAKETEWLTILDTDEFLFPVKENNLKQFTPWANC